MPQFKRHPAAAAWRVALIGAAVGTGGCQTGPTTPPPSLPQPTAADPTPKGAVSLTTAGPDAGPVATVTAADTRGQPFSLDITRRDLDEALYKSYGINLLSDLAVLDLGQTVLARSGQSPVTPAELSAERDRWFKTTFADAPPDDYPRYFAQLKQEKHLTDEEFDLGFRTTATLRKLAEPQVRGKVTEEKVRQAFGILYGENRQIADVAVRNAAEVADAHRRLASGEPFAQVAREMSVDPATREHGGELLPFSVKTPAVPAAVVEATFALAKVGDVSPDVINDGKLCHVIKLLAILPPKLVRFEDVEPDVRRQVEESVEQTVINGLRGQLQQAVLRGLSIGDPTLKGAWDAMVAAQQPRKTVAPADVGRQLDHGRAAGPPAPVTRPS